VGRDHDVLGAGAGHRDDGDAVLGSLEAAHAIMLA